MAHDPDYVIPFGKYQGRTLEATPSSYLKWIVETIENNDMLVDNAEGEHTWRTDHSAHFEEGE